MAGDRPRGVCATALAALVVGLLAGALLGPRVDVDPRRWPAPGRQAAPAPPPAGAPLRLEGAMAAWRAAAGESLHLVGALVTRPAASVVDRLQALLLRPAVHRLLDVPDSDPDAGEPPSWAKKELTEACKAVFEGTSFECPELHVVSAEVRERMETLPVGLWKRRHRIFISRGLLEGGVHREELRALFARELAHVAMGHWHMPRAWALLQAAGVSGLARGASGSLPKVVKQGLLRSWSQLEELCRTHSALALASARVRLLPEALELMPAPGRKWLEIEERYGTTMTEICELLEAPSSTAVRIQTMWLLYQKAQLAFEGPEDELKKRGQVRRPVNQWRLATVLRGRRKMHGEDIMAAVSTGAAFLAHRPVMLLALAVKRTGELAADRMAAEAVGSIEPVVAGLVRLYGSAEERRRLDRGDVRGIVESARAALGARGGLLRWELWWQSLVTGPTEPPLVLRVADLAAWAAQGEQGVLEPWLWAEGRD